MRPTIREILDFSGTVDDPAFIARERLFFYSIRLSNGVFKLTYPNRFDDLNKLVLKHIPRRKKAIEVMDVAASTAVTSVEWSQHLASAGFKNSMTAGDFSAMGWRLQTPFAEVLLESNGYPLQFDVGRRAIPNTPRNRHEFAAFRVLRTALRLWKKINPQVASCIAENRESSILRRQFLVSPRVLKSEIKVVVDDILSPNTPEMRSRCHAIRAANILNFDYFSNDDLKKIIGNLNERLKKGGILIVCKTEKDDTNNGTIFLKSGKKLKVIDQIGSGSLIQDLIISSQE